METGNEKKKEHREISYQVGWKKGKIQWNEGTSADTLRANSGDQDGLEATRKHLHYLWLPAMKLPKAVLFPLLYALPFLSFGLTLVLIFGLRRH
ncbi:hypothetical protein [Paenibacillus roseipurpureus]|uniref:Uncharacterized protein n=1 Tax=Paenibacillus roseopurpureus TaxID=2918901 RepID=A0AA96LL39_9BACL|nr:hypothetical protein [Paenibacillus sp. MBLB1832]WNR43081.1 hypothetical protein MJB10_18450 [Paenibacillus sp. MBLB1832]